MSSPCILLVEDSTTQALQISHILEAQGWTVVWKSTGEEAVKEIREGAPDLVLLDFYLPGVRGDELCRRIRMHVDSRELPIIMLTSETTTETELRGLESGADGFLHKSADPDILIARVRGFLAKAPAAKKPIVGTGSAPSLSQARLLAVDDDELFLSYLKAELATEGYAFEQCSTGREALVRLQNEAFDCVLIDLVMPDMDGLELCREVEKIRRKTDSSIAALVLTAHTSKEDLQRALEAGADDFVAKSSEISVLKWRIRALLRRKFFQQENHRIQSELKEKELETLRARAAQEIAEARASLVEELQRTAAELRASQKELSEAKEVAEAANRAKDHFLAVLSHELRTPLTPVLALLSDRRGDQSLPKELRDDLEMIHRNVELEARLIDDLLDLTRITRGKLELRREDVDAGPLLQHALQVCTPHEGQPGAKIETQFEATHTVVFGDSSRLIQVWWNLLRNALKFTPDDGTIILRTSNAPNPAEPGQPLLIVEVIDTGIGIAPEVLPRIFNAFEQGSR
ncbi:MAG: response regulator, partial [Chthoniobacteraceae bacterium]